MSNNLISVDNLKKSFGGLKAVDVAATKVERDRKNNDGR